jgi:hypothetical protein
MMTPRFDPAHMAQALEEGVTVFQGVPAMYARFLELLDAEKRPSCAPGLRYLPAAARRSISTGSGASRRASGSR